MWTLTTSRECDDADRFRATLQDAGDFVNTTTIELFDLVAGDYALCYDDGSSNGELTRRDDITLTVTSPQLVLAQYERVTGDFTSPPFQLELENGAIFQGEEATVWTTSTCAITLTTPNIAGKVTVSAANPARGTIYMSLLDLRPGSYSLCVDFGGGYIKSAVTLTLRGVTLKPASFTKTRGEFTFFPLDHGRPGLLSGFERVFWSTSSTSCANQQEVASVGAATGKGTKHPSLTALMQVAQTLGTYYLCFDNGEGSFQPTPVSLTVQDITVADTGPVGEMFSGDRTDFTFLLRQDTPSTFTGEETFFWTPAGSTCANPPELKGTIDKIESQTYAQTRPYPNILAPGNYQLCFEASQNNIEQVSGTTLIVNPAEPVPGQSFRSFATPPDKPYRFIFQPLPPGIFSGDTSSVFWTATDCNEIVRVSRMATIGVDGGCNIPLDMSPGDYMLCYRGAPSRQYTLYPTITLQLMSVPLVPVQSFKYFIESPVALELEADTRSSHAFLP